MNRESNKELNRESSKVEQGIGQGERNKSCEVAKKALQAGIPVKTISLMTGLTEKEIKELQPQA